LLKFLRHPELHGQAVPTVRSSANLGFDTVLELVNSVLLGAMRTAIKNAIGLHAMPYDAAATVGTGGRQRVDGTFETIKNMGCLTHTDFEALVVHIPAYFTSHSSSSHCLPLSSTFVPRGLRFLDVLPSRPGLRRGRFRTLGHVPARLGLKAITLELDRSRTQLLEQVFRFPSIPDKFAILHVGIFFADEPLHRRPSAASALPPHSLKVPWVPYVLRTEGFEVISRSQLDVIVFPLPTAARLLTSASSRL
jgi:hypothetical protein